MTANKEKPLRVFPRWNTRRGRILLGKTGMARVPGLIAKVLGAI